MIWGDITRSVNGENVLGGVVYKNKRRYVTVSEKRGNFAQNVKSCYEPVKFTCHIGNVLAAVVSSTNIFGTK